MNSIMMFDIKDYSQVLFALFRFFNNKIFSDEQYGTNSTMPDWHDLNNPTNN